MSSWIRNAASTLGSWVEAHESAIASTLAAIVVGAAVCALVVLTGGAALAALGPVAAAMIAGGAGGAAAGMTGYAVKHAIDGDGLHADELVSAGLLGLGAGILGAGLLPAATGLVGGAATRLGVSQATREAVVPAAARFVAGATVNGNVQIAQNLAAGERWTDGVLESAGTGGLMGAASPLTSRAGQAVASVPGKVIRAVGRTVAGRNAPIPLPVLGGAAIAPETPAITPETPALASAAEPEPPRFGIAQALDADTRPGIEPTHVEPPAVAPAGEPGAPARLSRPLPDGPLGEEPVAHAVASAVTNAPLGGERAP